MRGTGRVTKRIIAFVLSFIMVTGTFMTDYTIVRASEEVEETTSDVEETSEAEESEEPEAEEELKPQRRKWWRKKTKLQRMK